MRERVKAIVLPLVAWCRSNIIAIIVTVCLIAAAIWSITFAYMRGRSPGAPIAQAETISQDLTPEAFAETPNSADSNSTTMNNQSATAEDNGVTEEVNKTLGHVVDCKAVEQQAHGELQKTKSKFNPVTPEEVLATNTVLAAAFEKYSASVNQKGCVPSVSLDSLLFDAGTNIDASVPSIL